MKKIIYILFAFAFGINTVHATIIASGTAQTVALNFYKHTSQAPSANALLVYTETSTAGDPVYFVFNMNNTEGFVIVSAEDAGHPIIGYSTEGGYVIPTASSNPNLTWWMQQRKNEIEYVRAHNIQSDLKIADEWNSYITNKISPPQIMSSVAPLCSTNWGQTGYYNDLCPSNSKTGCVATAMAMIMKKWKHPAQGTGSSSYASNFGTLSVNYAAATYDWANMPNTVSSGSTSAQKNAVATLMYHCGVSVEMKYGPTGSSAALLGIKPSSQYSLFTYFGYDPTLIKNIYRSNYTDQAWIALLQGDLNSGRPVEYAGTNASGTSGHAWVCDGYDGTNNFHMNWGWDGGSNGYFSINNINPGGYSFSSQHQACVGIQPKSATGIASINSADGFSAYPNPFRDITAVQFQLTTTDNVTVKVYDMYGKEAKTLVNTMLVPGEHTFYWEGDDGNGNTVAGGVYFYTVSTSSQSVSKPMIFINK